jgi:hypothetical protein
MLIKKYLRIFWIDVFSKLDNNQYMLIQFKILNKNNEFRSISYVQRVNKSEFNSLYNIFIEYWDIRSEDYHQMDVQDVVFTYKILSLSLKINVSKLPVHKKKNIIIYPN